MSSNNDLISDLAEEVRGYHKTNNQLLEELALNTDEGTPLVRQDNIATLNPDDTNDADVVNKINEIILALRGSGVVDQ